MSTIDTRRTFAAAAIALLVSAWFMLAPSGSASAQSAETGWVRFGHFAPSVQAVDIQVDGQPFASNVAFRSVSDYVPLEPGPHRFDVRPAGQPAADPVLAVDADVPAGGAVTIGAVTTLDGIAPQIYQDLLETPPPGQASVRFIHSAPDVAAVDVRVVDGPVLASGVPYPEANDYQPIDPGLYQVEVLETGTDTVLLRVDGWEVAPGTQASIIIVRGLDDRLDVVPVQDAASAPVAPVGGVQTGFGGMAGADDRASAPGAAVPAMSGAVVLVAAGLAFARRRAIR